jgi:hypothetical protein
MKKPWGRTHPAIIARSPVDHIVPGSAGGDWRDSDNLARLVGKCATFSREMIGTGLTSQYPALWRASGQPKPAFHLAWIAALGCAEDA